MSENVYDESIGKHTVTEEYPSNKPKNSNKSKTVKTKKSKSVKRKTKKV